ncbi:MAG: hypothetical protein K5662_03940 [Lachnospiraceae bacterium]|nr:hypothetical protein [Lachnospiraceae bacterium]
MEKNVKRVIFLCSSFILLIIIILFVLWLNYAPIIAYPFRDLQNIKISYFDEKNAAYSEKIIEDVDEKELIYQLLQRAKLIRVDRWGGDECGSDSGWYLWLYFDDAIECYDSDVYSLEFGCRKYIRNKKSGQVEGSLIISSRELFDEVEKIIMDR